MGRFESSAGVLLPASRASRGAGRLLVKLPVAFPLAAGKTLMAGETEAQQDWGAAAPPSRQP